MVSIKSIAKECGVSVATVSKALNDRSDISSATKKKIQKVAMEMGYTTNIGAKALRTNKTYNLGVLFADNSASLTHEFFSLILESFQDEARVKGYDLTFLNHTIAGKKSTYLNHVKYRNLDGVVIMSANFKNKEILELVKSNIPVVVIDYIYDNCAAVLSDNTKGTEALLKYAYEMGHRKIAFIHGEMTDVTNERMNGFYKACRELDLKIPSEYIKESNYHDISTCKQKTKELLELVERPTCIIFPDDYSYLGGLEAINEHGLSVPADISAIGYDGINLAKLLELTTYEQNTSAMGKLAADKLINMIENPDSDPEHVIVTGKLLCGKSVKKI